MPARAFALGTLAVLLWAALAQGIEAQGTEVPAPRLPWPPVLPQDTSSDGSTAPDAAWVPVAAFDAASPTAMHLDPDRGLALVLATLDTDPATVKLRGLRSRHALPLAGPEATSGLGLTMEWTDHPNGCYLSMELVLAPAAVDGDPRVGPDWLRFAYVGVPPQRRARGLLEECRNGRRRSLYDEGWPQEQREGREVERERVELRWADGALDVTESGRRLHRQEEWTTGWEQVWVYLYVTGHSNYPARTVWFDGVEPLR